MGPGFRRFELLAWRRTSPSWPANQRIHFHWSAYARMAVGHAIILFLLVSVVLGFEPAESAGILHLGLIWYLIHAAQQFVRMLFIQPRGA